MKHNTFLSLWDALAGRFNTYKPNRDIHPDAVVNLYVGWPTFLQQIEFQSGFLGKKSLDILDFGCGTGKFCKKIYEMGHNVIGTDISKKMLELAKKNARKEITFVKINNFNEFISFLKNERKFDVITSIHVLDWIKDIEITILGLSKLLRKDGIMLFCVFPKQHISDSIKIKDLFENFDSAENPKIGVANFDGIKIPVFVRGPETFDHIFHDIGFERILESYPPYPKVFLKKYNWTGSLYPEMMIMGYRKL